jgi:hypothetical protein
MEHRMCVWCFRQHLLNTNLPIVTFICQSSRQKEGQEEQHTRSEIWCVVLLFILLTHADRNFAMCAKCQSCYGSRRLHFPDCPYVLVAHNEAAPAITKLLKKNSQSCAKMGYHPKGKLVRNDQNCAWFISKTMHSFDRLCRSCIVDQITFAQIQPQIRRKKLKLDENVFGCTCFVVLDSSIISSISQCHRPVVTGVTWGWTM